MSFFFQATEASPFACLEVFSPEECEEIIRIGDSGLVDAMVRRGDESEIDEDIRKSKIAWLSANGNDWVYKKLSDAVIFLNEHHFKFDLIGFAEDLQFTKYSAGGKYGPHIDCTPGRIRKLSVSVQLSNEDSYKGGDLGINYGREIVLPRKQGTIIAFPSIAVHSVHPVTEGVRFSLVGWVTGPRFR